MSNIIDFKREQLSRRTSKAKTKKVICGCGKGRIMYYVPAGSMDASKSVYQCILCGAAKVTDTW